MTTRVPTVYAFRDFDYVAEAVADLIISAQNMTLYNTLDQEEIKALKAKAKRPTLTTSLSSSSVNGKVKKERKRKEETRFKIAISGGSLIKILNSALLKKQSHIEWSKWDVYFADERLVPFESESSNYGRAMREVFEHIEGPDKPNVYHIDESLISDPVECGDDYEKLLINNFARKDSVKLPMFDLLLLGCAPDGHVASLFPNHGEQLREKHAWVLPVSNAPSDPPNRITLSIPVICHAHRVSFVVEGSTKAPVIRTIMERPEKGLPSSIVNEGAAGRVTWFVDDDALQDCYDVTKRKYKYLSLPDPAESSS